MDRCWNCGTTRNLERHHVFYGAANRRLSDRDGMVVSLCAGCHRGNTGVHHNAKLDLQLKQEAQKVWMTYTGRDEKSFRRRYGKSYLDPEEIEDLKKKIWSGSIWR